MAIFPIFFLGNIGQENIFYDILERKNANLGYKTRSLKSQKIDIFSNWLTHGFLPKMAIFPVFLGEGGGGYIGHEDVFYDILERKNAFLSCKSKKFKKSKN